MLLESIMIFVRRIIKSSVLLVVFFAFGISVNAQSTVFVDGNGVMKYADTGEEAVFFGVNYSPPFAHSYRAINQLGEDHKEVIDQDSYHFARLGFDGFRIHVWDTEISDSLGHVVSNEHLDLLDYMLAKLKQRGIKVILTPLTFYDNGYPEPPTETDGFANYISKADAPVESEHWPVIKRYLEEFINHKNPYTGLTYKEDPNIIAVEIVNEPTHGGEQDSVTSYVNMLTDHLRNHNWEKPIFYNISQNPSMAEGVMNADIEGTSFQWYPGGLVGGAAIQKNYLPYIADYSIPFADEPAFQNKAQMVYEFSAADFMGSYALPAMARSFRETGFQWATQFAYDPMVMAPYNTDYRTHYLNMAYTPAKAVSMKIASAAFHQLPRGENFGPYPENNTFGDFRVSHEENLSEFNADTAFFYSNDTDTSPKNTAKLKHIAGVGSSSVVAYEGTGAYFLDKVDNGVWRLEVMPDAIHAKDPFATVALDKRLTWIEWQEHQMTVDLPELGNEFRIQGINSGNDKQIKAKGSSFKIAPGTYLLISGDEDLSQITVDQKVGNYRLNEFVAPEATKSNPIVRHEPKNSIVAGESAQIKATVAGLHPEDSVKLLVQSGWQPQKIVMKETEPYQYEADIPAKMINTGFLTYWIVVEHGKKSMTFPGGFKGSPADWDYYHDQQWQVQVVDPNTPIELFNAADDLGDISYAFQFWNSESSMNVVSTETPGAMAMEVSAPKKLANEKQELGWKTYVGDELEERSSVVDRDDQLVLKAKGKNASQAIKVIVVEKDGSSYSATFDVSNAEFSEHHIPFETFQPDSMMLLPRPYPTFLPLWFKSSDMDALNPADIEEIQFLLMPESDSLSGQGDFGFAVESAWIEHSNN